MSLKSRRFAMKLSEVSLSVIKAHCGVSGEDSDEFPDVTVAFLNMVNEMFAQRCIMTSDTLLNEF